ncbi:MAG: cellulose biosynthesis cyclic di-GMP-binding regulatory protein BcsB [Bacteroidetes bacterium]|nr:cellulose biosynthesis cyclic di-GMP-binding regulatory protein BcsB [Bacteroidota bacterium]MCL5025012.1 cellulose biosynthesis cyclic di-GMP-binding regulatory protein BcsB [Chloroflexota bacterium]
MILVESHCAALNRIMLALLTIIGLLLNVSAALADRGAPEPDISLKQLKMGNITVQGYQPTMSLWFPGYGDYQVTDGNYLHLEYSRSELINPKFSSVTVYLNGLPLASTLLTEQTAKRTTWEIALPRDKLNRDLNLVELKYNMFIYEGNCGAEGDGPKYSTVYEESFIHYQYASPLKFIPFRQPDLGRFPEPFIRPTLPDGEVAIILPDNPSSGDYSAAASVAARFGQVAGGKPFTATLHFAGEAPGLRSAGDLVVVGTPDANPFLEELTPSLPLKYKRQDGQAVYIDPAGQPIAPDTGVIQVMKSPWDERFAVLVVSGGNEEGLSRAMRALSSRLGVKAMQGPYATITRASEELTKAAKPEGGDGGAIEISLQQLGLSDSVFDGAGSHATGFSFDVPPLDRTQEAYFELDMSYSPILSPWVSSVRFSVNGVPVWTRLLDEEHSNRSKHRILVPTTALRPGVNSAKVQFDLYTRYVPECSPLALERAWAVLHADSAFSIPVGTARPPLDLLNLPYPFVRDGTPSGTYLVLPDDRSLLRDSLQVAVALGRQSLGASTELKAGVASQISDEAKRSYDLIGYGLPESNTLIAEAQSKLPLSQEGRTERLLQKPQSVLVGVQDQAELGFIQLVPSPWNDDKGLLVVSGTSPDLARQAGQALQSALPSGNVAVVGGAPSRVAGMKISGEAERPAARVPTYRRVYSAAGIPVAIVVLGLVGLMLYRAERQD